MDPDPDPGGPKHVDPGDLDPNSDPDPDPQHCSYVNIEFLGHKYS